MLCTYEPKTVCLCCGNTKTEVRQWPNMKCIDEQRHVWNTNRITWEVQLLEIPEIRKDGA